MNLEDEPQLDVSFTYLLPMREDDSAFADFAALRQEVTEVMGEGYPSPLITRINTMLAGNGFDFARAGVVLHHAIQETGRPGSVRAVTFEAPLTIERVCEVGRRIGPVAARALVTFAEHLQTRCEAGELHR